MHKGQKEKQIYVNSHITDMTVVDMLDNRFVIWIVNDRGIR